MTVEELIKKLETLPKDKEVYIPNDSLWINGVYKVTNVKADNMNIVVIGTDYEERSKLYTIKNIG